MDQFGVLCPGSGKFDEPLRASSLVEATPMLKKPANPCVHAQNKRNQHLANARCPLLY